jgi:hypothetical protein
MLRSISTMRAGQTAVAHSDQPSGLRFANEPDPQTFVVRAGSRAILLLDGGHVHVRLNVVCLENGAAGQRIRVEARTQSRRILPKWLTAES